MKKIDPQKKIIVDPMDPFSIEFQENGKISALAQEKDVMNYIHLIEKRVEISEKLNKILTKKEYPLLLKKIIEFRTKFPDEYSKEELSELKDFFKVLKVVAKLLKHFHFELVKTMIGASAIGLGCKTKSRLCHKYNIAFFDEEVRRDFWKTKFLEPILVVNALLDDLNESNSLEDLTKENLCKSCLVSYCLAQEDDTESDKVLEQFIAFCQE